MFDSLFPSHWTTLRKLMWLKLKGASAVWSTISGNPVSFTAKAAPLRQLKVAFSPVQDLHGYDAPWPAGGGKNKLGYLETGTYSIANVGSISYQKDNSVFTVDSTLTGAFGYRFGNKCKVTLAAGTYYLSSNVAGQSVGDGVFAYNVATSDVLARARAEGGASFTLTEQTEVALGVSLKNGTTAGTYNFQIELGSTPTSYSPYSNECPISGWDSLNVEQRGVNVWDGTFENGKWLSSYTTGEVSNASTTYNVTGFIPVHPNTQYYMMETGSSRNMFYDSEKNAIPLSSWSITDAAKVITSPANAAYMRFTLTNAFLPNFALNYPSTDHDYHAYNPSSRSISITLGQTVYSGVLDVVTGVVTVTWAKSLLKDLTWSWYYKITGILRADPPKANGKANLMFTSFKYSGSVPYASLSNGEATGRDDAATIYVCNTEYATKNLSDWLASLTDDDYVVYELAEPFTIQLTPQEVQSLAGDNTMWSDANGDLTVEYRSN